MAYYLETNKLLPYFQYGYRKQHNTGQAVLDYIHTINNNLKQKYTSISIFMDLSKAFDTVNRQILCNKLRKLGFDTTSYKLIENYITNRTFCFKNESEHYNLEHGVPQGSILGPLLFLIYIYDMKHIAPNNKVIVYADDTTVIIKGRNLTEAIQHGNDILNRFLLYFNQNKLSINPDKTKYMIHQPITSVNTCKSEKLIMDNEQLEQVKEIKFLGVILNDKLTWENHKNYLKRKISQCIGIIYNCKNIMTEQEIINIYKTFIQSNFLYAIEAWGHSIKPENDILTTVQNKVLRIIFECKRSEDAWYYAKNRIPTVKQLYTSTITNICKKHYTAHLPEYFASTIMPEQKTADIHNHDVRSTDMTQLNYKLCSIDNNFSFQQNCVKIWNKIDIKLKQSILNKLLKTVTTEEC